LLNSADRRHPDGLGNSSGLVGRNLMVQANQAVYGTMDEEIRWYKGPPSLSITEHWNYTDTGKEFFGGYCYMSQEPPAARCFGMPFRIAVPAAMPAASTPIALIVIHRNATANP
jgi:hypothetical protein